METFTDGQNARLNFYIHIIFNIIPESKQMKL
jgi:hypothetical protein